MHNQFRRQPSTNSEIHRQLLAAADAAGPDTAGESIQDRGCADDCRTDLFTIDHAVAGDQVDGQPGHAPATPLGGRRCSLAVGVFDPDAVRAAVVIAQADQQAQPCGQSQAGSIARMESTPTPAPPGNSSSQLRKVARYASAIVILWASGADLPVVHDLPTRIAAVAIRPCTVITHRTWRTPARPA